VIVKPAEEPSNLKADGSALLHVSPTASSTTAEDSRPKHLQNEQSNLEPDPTDLGLKSLWDEAYNALRKMDSKLIDAYEKDLLVSRDPHQQGTSMRVGFLPAERHQISSCHQ
jgi:hypothetical protein